MNLLEILLGQIPEAIFLSLFMIFTKSLHTKRFLFIIITIIEYLIWMGIFPYSWYFHIGLMVSIFLTLKILYKEKITNNRCFHFVNSLYHTGSNFSHLFYSLSKRSYYSYCNQSSYYIWLSSWL